MAKNSGVTKKFYVGSRSAILSGDWAHATLQQALKHATELVSEDGEDQYVVQVIRHVKRRQPDVDIVRI